MKKKIITNKAIEGTASILANRLAKSFFTPPYIEGIAGVINRLSREQVRLDKTLEEMLVLLNKIENQIKQIKNYGGKKNDN